MGQFSFMLTELIHHYSTSTDPEISGSSTDIDIKLVLPHQFFRPPIISNPLSNACTHLNEDP